jgi:RNA polymerase sigma-70 factor (ECF subfamily)
MDPAVSMSDAEESGAPLEERLVAETPALRAFVRRLIGRAGRVADAEDVVQEALARALRYRASFDSRRALGPWLRTAALRTFLDHCTRSRTTPEDIAQHTDHLAAPARDGVDEREELDSTLARLDPVERDVLMRFHRRGQSIREIAKALGAPEGTVKSLLHRARRKLGERAKEEER